MRGVNEIAAHVCLRVESAHSFDKYTTHLTASSGVFLAGINDSSATSPALVVSGMGHLSVPIPTEQTSQLQALCSPAPGRLNDATIGAEQCAAWQLDSSKFQCTNPGQTCLTTHDFAQYWLTVAHKAPFVNANRAAISGWPSVCMARLHASPWLLAIHLVFGWC